MLRCTLAVGSRGAGEPGCQAPPGVRRFLASLPLVDMVGAMPNSCSGARGTCVLLAIIFFHAHFFDLTHNRRTAKQQPLSWAA